MLESYIFSLINGYCAVFRGREMDGTDSGDRPTVELFVKV